MKDIQTLFAELKNSDAKIRQAASLNLLALEQSELLNLNQISYWLELYGKDVVVTVYLIEALARRAYLNDDKAGFKIIAEFFKKNQDLLVILAVLDCFTKLKDPYFSKVVLDKLGLVGFWRRFLKIYLNGGLKKLKGVLSKKDHEADGLFSQSEIKKEIVIATLRYFQTCADHETAQKLFKLIHDKNDLVRYHTMLVFYKKDLPLDDVILKDIAANDLSELNKQQAQLMLTDRKK